MRLLADWAISHGNGERRIQLLHGDLSQLPPEHSVDILVVSAFPNDYLPTPTSLIGALYRTGISVERLSRSKQIDMREESSCWLSEPVLGTTAFRHLLCLESGWRGTPPEITDDLFRAVAPLFATIFPGGSLAMPVLGAGDQGWPADRMLKSLLQAALSWLNRGLSVSVMKIVVYSNHAAQIAERTFLEFQRTQASSRNYKEEKEQQAVVKGRGYDLFVSYCRDDLEIAQTLVTSIAQQDPTTRIFFDQTTLLPGISWLMSIAESLDNARRVVALFTPSYWSSRPCKDEFTAAFTRQSDIGELVLFPIYFRSASIPYLFRNLQFADCREADLGKLTEAAKALCTVLS